MIKNLKKGAIAEPKAMKQELKHAMDEERIGISSYIAEPKAMKQELKQIILGRVEVS